MRIISIINLKGGVGKTTTAMEMGYILHKRYGYRVLLVDNDKQGNLSRGGGPVHRQQHMPSGPPAIRGAGTRTDPL